MECEGYNRCKKNGIDTLRKTGRMLIWGSHRPQHGVTNVKSLVAIDEIGFKVLIFGSIRK
jgi:hypothetical protein